MDFFRRRRFKRQESDQLIHFLLTGKDGTVHGRGTGRTRNISGAGLLLETNTRLKNGQFLTLTLPFDDMIVDLKGQIVHVETFNEKWLWAGVEFRNLSTAARGALKGYLAVTECG